MIISANGTRKIYPAPGRTYVIEALTMPSGASVAVKGADAGVAGQTYETLSAATQSVVTGPVSVNEIHLVTTGLPSGETIKLGIAKQQGQ